MSRTFFIPSAALWWAKLTAAVNFPTLGMPICVWGPCFWLQSKQQHQQKKIPGRGLPDSWQYLQLGLVLLRQYVSSTLTNYPWWHEVRLDSWPFLFWFTRSDGILRGRHISYPVSQIESTVKASMLDLKNLFSDHKLLLFFAPNLSLFTFWKRLSNRKKDRRGAVLQKRTLLEFPPF